ncbi:MAG: hypothetical protein ABI566_09720 [Pseudolysinimonas sp.]
MPPSRRSADAGDERGSASLEFITAGLVLLVPVVYLVIALSAVQSATLALNGAARQATRVYVQSATVAEARAAAARAIEVTLADYGLDAAVASVQITCRPRATACLTRRGFVTVTIGLTVPLPLAPPFLDTGLPAGLPIAATATEQVSRFWGSR